MIFSYFLCSWDTQDHKLADNGLLKLFPGKDYYNPLIQEFFNVHEPWQDIVDRDSLPRMPWHDVHMSVDGTAARDVARNFIQRWNHHKEVIASPFPYLIPRNRFVFKFFKKVIIKIWINIISLNYQLENLN